VKRKEKFFKSIEGDNFLKEIKLYRCRGVSRRNHFKGIPLSAILQKKHSEYLIMKKEAHFL
jgi:hypothetical protein